MESIIPGVLGPTTRSLTTVELAGRPARRAVIVRSFPTDPADLWSALTDPERVPRWFLPISGDLRVGGRYQLEGNAGGTVEECEPPRRLRVTWEFGDGDPTWVTLTLAPDGAATRLELEHVGAVPEALWRLATRRGSVGYVKMPHVGDQSPVDPPQASPATSPAAPR